LLACDGIWDVKSSREAIDFMNQTLYKNSYNNTKTLADFENSMALLLEECCAQDITVSQGLGCDNITAIIVEINQRR